MQGVAKKHIWQRLQKNISTVPKKTGALEPNERR